MANYTFRTKSYEESGESTYYAISPDRIKTLQVAATYNAYGQQIGSYDAGDYALDNSGCDAKADCETAIFEKFNLKVSVDTDVKTVETVGDDDADEWVSESEIENAETLISEMNAFISKWCAENENMTTCKGFDYWDGSNWKTITVEFEFHGEPSHKVVEDEDLIAELNNAIQNKEFLKDGFGYKEYAHEGWVVTASQFQGSWAAYTLNKPE